MQPLRMQLAFQVLIIENKLVLRARDYILRKNLKYMIMIQSNRILSMINFMTVNLRLINRSLDRGLKTTSKVLKS